MRIDVQNVEKKYINKETNIYANRNVTLSIGENEFIGIFGENGSGKTTLVREILGIIIPDKGVIKYDGTKINPKLVSSNRIGYMSQSNYAPLYNLTIKEATNIIAKLKGVSKEECDSSFSELFSYFEISEKVMSRFFYNLSGGQKRIISFCFSLLGNPEVLFLDEPSNDLDPRNRYLMWNYIKQLYFSGTSIIMVTHNIAEVENYISRVVLMNKGRIKLDENKEKLIKSYNNYEKIIMYFKCLMSMELAYKEISEREYFRCKKMGSNTIMIILKKKSNKKYFEKLTDLVGYQISEVNLEDICFD